MVANFSLWKFLLRYYLFFIAVPFVATNVFFVLGVTFGIPLSDEWRWVKELLIPLHRNEISVFEYLTGEYAFLSHSHYLALLFLWFDFEWLDLNFNYFTYAGVVFYVLAYGAILLYLKENLQKDLCVNIAALLILSVGYFCITSDFPWLLVVFEYVYFFIAIITLLVLDSFLQGRSRLPLLSFTLLGCLLLADTIGMAAVFLSVIVLFANALFVREKRKAFFVVVAIITLFFSLQYFWFGAGIGGSPHSRIDTLFVLLRNPTDVLISFMSIFSQPLVDINILRFIGGEYYAPVLQFVLGVCGFILTSCVCYCYLKSDGLKKSQLPLIFIGYSILIWALIFISRYQDYGVSVMDEPRYVRLFTLIYVGVAVAFLCMVHTVKTRKLLYCAAAALVLSYSGTVIFKYWQDQYIESYFMDARVELIKEPVDSAALAIYIGRCANDYCVEALDFMKENQLSIFKDQNVSQNKTQVEKPVLQ